MSGKSILKKIIFWLTGIEHPSVFLQRLVHRVCMFFWRPFLHSPSLYAKLENILIRIRISNRCNAKCKFCGLRCSEVPDIDMDPKWIYDYCAPLYEKADVICFTHGESVMAPRAFELFSHIAEKYPQATISTESNGIGFDSKWQQLAADHLFRTSFSMNAVTEETFLRAVWEKDAPGGENAYRISRRNVGDFIQLLERRGLLCFAPCFSMVVSTESMHETIDFIRMALKMKAGFCQFFFELFESPVNMEFFRKKELHDLLIEIEKIKILLQGHFHIQGDLYAPWGEIAIAKEIASKIPVVEIMKQYQDIYDLAAGRSVFDEYMEREKFRAQAGKKPFSFESDQRVFLQLMPVEGKEVCAHAWKQIDLFPSGGVQFCGWMTKDLLNLQDYIKDDAVDWEQLFNAPEMRLARKQILAGDYRNCMKCCPLIPMESRKKIK